MQAFYAGNPICNISVSTNTQNINLANTTRPIPGNGGVRQVNVLMNLGNADYDGLQTQVTYRGYSQLFASLELHTVKDNKHERAGWQRHQSEPEYYHDTWRAGTRPKRTRPASSCGAHT